MRDDQAGYKILDHPADLGIEAWGATLAKAFEQAAQALLSIILDLETVQPTQTIEVRLDASDKEHLLVKWLSEILYLYDGQQFVSKHCAIEQFAPNHLKAAIKGATFSEQTHVTRLDVKAVTYHQIAVHEDERGGWVRVFLDI